MKAVKKYKKGGKSSDKKYFLGGFIGGLSDQAGRGVARFVGDKLRQSKLGERLGLETPDQGQIEEMPGDGGSKGDITITVSKNGNTKTFKKGGKIKKKGRSFKDLDAAQKEVYRRGLAAYMSSGNRPKTSQHAWAMARVNSEFGKNEADKIRAKKK